MTAFLHRTETALRFLTPPLATARLQIALSGAMPFWKRSGEGPAVKRPQSVRGGCARPCQAVPACRPALGVVPGGTEERLCGDVPYLQSGPSATHRPAFLCPLPEEEAGLQQA